MFVKTVKVQIVKNQKSTISKVVPAYEAELLKAVFGEESIVIDQTAQTKPREITSVEAEEARLVDAYVQKHIEQLHGVNFSDKLKKAVESAKAAIRKQSAEV